MRDAKLCGSADQGGLRGASCERLAGAIIDLPPDGLQRHCINRGRKLGRKRRALADKNETVATGCGWRWARHLLRGRNRRGCLGLHAPILLTRQAGEEGLV